MPDDELDLIGRLVRSPEILAEVAAAGGEELHLQTELRKKYPAELVRAALTLHDLRRRARGKFSRADRMWFDRVGLEQATAEHVADYKARRFSAGRGPVFDLCCGIGSDAIALARRGDTVVAVDRSPAACLRTQLNAEIYEVADRIEVRTQDVTQLTLPPAFFHLDPDRRAGRARVIRLEDYTPGLEFLQQLTRHAPGGAIKLSPASNFGGKFPGCEIELISLHRECKEATVWCGELRQPEAMRATFLPEGESIAGNPWEHRPHVGPLGRYLFDPDPAVVRAGLVDLLAQTLNLKRLDAAEEYLTGDQPVMSAAVTPFEVLAELSHNDKEIRRYFRGADVGEVEIKARHVPVDVEALRRKLPLSGTGKAVLIIARLNGKTRALVCRRDRMTASSA